MIYDEMKENGELDIDFFIRGNKMESGYLIYSEGKPIIFLKGYTKQQTLEYMQKGEFDPELFEDRKTYGYTKVLCRTLKDK